MIIPIDSYTLWHVFMFLPIIIRFIFWLNSLSSVCTDIRDTHTHFFVRPLNRKCHFLQYFQDKLNAYAKKYNLCGLTGFAGMQHAN